MLLCSAGISFIERCQRQKMFKVKFRLPHVPKVRLVEFYYNGALQRPYTGIYTILQETILKGSLCPLIVFLNAKYAPLLFFLHHPKTAQGIKLKLSDFKDTPLRHILGVKPVRYTLICCHGNKITEGTSQNVASKKSEKSARY